MVTLTLGVASVSISITSAEVTELNVNPQVVDLYGDVITISGNATPGEEVWLSSSFELLLPVSNGEYSREFIGIDFPAGEKEVSVTAENVTTNEIATPTPTSTMTDSGDVTPSGTSAPSQSPNQTPTPRRGIPGFDAVFAIAVLLAVAYLVLFKRRYHE